MKSWSTSIALVIMVLVSLAFLAGCPSGQPGAGTGSSPGTGGSTHPSPGASSTPVKVVVTEAAFWEAVSGGDTDKVSAILKEKAEYVKLEDSNKNTPLHIAASEGKAEVVSILLKNGAKPNALNAAGRTPLHETISGAVAVNLVAGGADKTIKDKEGMDPLQRAKKENKADVLKCLKIK